MAPGVEALPTKTAIEFKPPTPCVQRTLQLSWTPYMCCGVYIWMHTHGKYWKADMIWKFCCFVGEEGEEYGEEEQVGKGQREPQQVSEAAVGKWEETLRKCTTFRELRTVLTTSDRLIMREGRAVSSVCLHVVQSENWPFVTLCKILTDANPCSGDSTIKCKNLGL